MKIRKIVQKGGLNFVKGQFYSAYMYMYVEHVNFGGYSVSWMQTATKLQLEKNMSCPFAVYFSRK